jgi:glucokinase
MQKKEEFMGYTLGVDLGGTKLQIGAIDQSAKVLASKRVPTDVQGGPAKVIEQIIQLSHELIDELGSTPDSIGIGVPGQIDPKNGIVIFAPNLKWHNVSLRDQLQKALSIPIHLINDVQAATIGEWQVGAGQGYSDIVCIFVGTGIGGGIVSQGKFLAGATHTAGEVGHMVIEMNGRTCACGRKGCLEAYAGGWAIAKQAGRTSAKEVSEDFKKGEAYASTVMHEATEALIVGGVNIANILNPQLLIFGGGVINGTPELLEPIRKGILERALIPTIKVLPSALTGTAGMIGAGLYERK